MGIRLTWTRAAVANPYWCDCEQATIADVGYLVACENGRWFALRQGQGGGPCMICPARSLAHAKALAEQHARRMIQ